jgi:hypothetical protein
MVLADQINDLPLTWGLLGMMGTVAVGTAYLTWFVRDQFTKQTRLIYRIISKHNREDDDRFEAISTDMWNIREHLARQNGQEIPPRKTFPRRRYLMDDQGNGVEEAEATG